MCNVSHFIFYVCGNSAVLDDCIVPSTYRHIPTTTTKQNGMPHTCSCGFDPTNTWDGRSMGWTNEITFVLRTHQTKLARGKRSYVERIVPSPGCTIRRDIYHANGILLNNPVTL